MSSSSNHQNLYLNRKWPFCNVKIWQKLCAAVASTVFYTLKALPLQLSTTYSLSLSTYVDASCAYNLILFIDNFINMR